VCGGCALTERVVFELIGRLSSSASPARVLQAARSSFELWGLRSMAALVVVGDGVVGEALIAAYVTH